MQIGRTLKDQLKDFKVTLSYDKSGKLPPSISSPFIAAFEVRGIVEAVEKYVVLNVMRSIDCIVTFVENNFCTLVLGRQVLELCVEFS